MKKRKLELRDFQKEDVAFMKQHDYRVLVANGQGTGKTIECLAAISIDRVKLCPVIIVCPSSVLLNWKIEARKWCRWARVHVVADKSTRIPTKRTHIYIVSWALLAERLEELMRIPRRLVIGDEAQYAKSEDALRTKALMALTDECPHILLLSGTPIINHRSELETLHKILKNDNPPMIRRLLRDVAPDVPNKSRMTLPVYIRPRHATQYRKAFEEFDEWLREELEKRMSSGEAESAIRRALAAEALIKIGYLRRLVGVAKTYACVDFISRAVRVGEPVVVFCDHNEPIRRVQAMLKRQNIGFVTIRGSTPKVQRQKNVERFQRGEVPVFIGTRAAHTGITLTRARHLVFLERFWTSADEEQAEDRVRRISQKYPTKIWFLHAMGTVDDRISDIIIRKRRIVAAEIGSEDVEEKEEDYVMDMIAKWSEQVGAPVHNGDAMLGLARSLPPLPKSKTVQSISFKGSRWNEASVRAWCKMNKYRINKIRHRKAQNRWEVILRNASNFNPGTIKTVKVSKQIQIVCGEPIKKNGKRFKVRHSPTVRANARRLLQQKQRRKRTK